MDIYFTPRVRLRVTDRSKSGYHRLFIHAAGSQQCHGAQQIQVVARNAIGEISSTCKIESESRLINGMSVSDMASPGTLNVGNVFGSLL